MEQPTHTLAASTSEPLTFRVTRQAQESFIAPTVLEAANNGTGPLDPIDALRGATVRVRYDGMQTTDILVVDWDGGATAANWQSAQEAGSVVGYVDFLVPVSVVAASQGKSVTIVYVVLRNGQPRSSQPLELAVGELAVGELNEPTVPEAPDKTLDLAAFAGDARVVVQPWPLIAQGQRYWIKVSGELENGSAYFFYVAQNLPVTEDEEKAGLDKPLLRAELEKFKDGANLEIELSVAFDHLTPRQFPNLTIVLLKAITVMEDFRSFSAQQLVVGNPLTSVTGVIITPEIVTCKRDKCTALWIDSSAPLHMADGSIIKFTAGNRARTLTVGYHYLHTVGHYVELFGASGRMVSYTLPASGYATVEVDIHSTNNAPILFVRVRSVREAGEDDTGFLIDYLIWR
ncbi:hypothetical protein VA602_04300 [Pseudomonas sp. MH2]|uniref:Uncharacterized protein n=1 Tax=Pseudomonas machongensis TaxID=3110229 RepID=A0ABU5VB15_9PSED|nr:hypothetical protein [Pseudomonas sp. MH2]MEA5670552.1 hypothetical protein [Pseudomonas sp. MH2]